MALQLRYFAAARECVGLAEEPLDEVEGEQVAALLQRLVARHPRLAPRLGLMKVAVNRAFASPTDVVPAGAEVALIPPVGGGAGPLVGLRAEPLSLDEVVHAVTGPEHGAVVTFTGAVRAQSRGQTIRKLEYEAYAEMAEGVLHRIAEGCEAAHGARVAVLHRVGTLQVGELAVVIAAAAPHRAEAFAACREVIERLKAEVPIWKREFGDGDTVWVGMGP